MTPEALSIISAVRKLAGMDKVKKDGCNVLFVYATENSLVGEALQNKHSQTLDVASADDKGRKWTGLAEGVGV